MESSNEGDPDSSPFSKKISVNTVRDLSLNGAKGPLVKSGSFFVVEIVTNIEKCHSLWQKFSPQRNLFDTWEFRYAFYRGYQFLPYFLLLKRRPTKGGSGYTENLALLPLWFDSDRKIYTWFGSDWQEEVSFFTKDLNLIPLLISLAPSPLYLNAISADSIMSLKNKIEFEGDEHSFISTLGGVWENDEPKYILNLEGFKNHEDWLKTLKKNSRRDLRKDRNRILRQKPEIILNNFSDIDELIRLSKKRFKEEADWEDERRRQTFKEVINLGGSSYQPRMITIRINGKVAGVDLVCLLKETYFTVKCGYDVKNFSGIGNFMNLFEIDDAISLGMKKIDFLQNSYQWKNRWFQAIPLYKVRKL